MLRRSNCHSERWTGTGIGRQAGSGVRPETQGARGGFVAPGHRALLVSFKATYQLSVLANASFVAVGQRDTRDPPPVRYFPLLSDGPFKPRQKVLRPKLVGRRAVDQQFAHVFGTLRTLARPRQRHACQSTDPKQTTLPDVLQTVIVSIGLARGRPATYVALQRQDRRWTTGVAHRRPRCTTIRRNRCP